MHASPTHRLLATAAALLLMLVVAAPMCAAVVCEVTPAAATEKVEAVAPAPCHGAPMSVETPAEPAPTDPASDMTCCEAQLAPATPASTPDAEGLSVASLLPADAPAMPAVPGALSARTPLSLDLPPPPDRGLFTLHAAFLL